MLIINKGKFVTSSILRVIKWAMQGKETQLAEDSNGCEP